MASETCVARDCIEKHATYGIIAAIVGVLDIGIKPIPACRHIRLRGY